MKKQNILLTGLILSAGIVAAQEQKQENLCLDPTNFSSFSEIAKYQHRYDLTNIKAPKPPRLVPPNEYQRIQAKLAANFDGIGKLRLKKSFETSKPSKMFTKISATTAGCNSPADLDGLTGDELIQAIKGGDLNACLYGLYDNNLAGSDVFFSDVNLLSVVQSIGFNESISFLQDFDFADVTTQYTGASFMVNDNSSTPVPAPATLLLFVSGLALIRMKRKNN